MTAIGRCCRKSPLSAPFVCLALVLGVARCQRLSLVPDGYPLTPLRRCQVGRRREQAERHGLEVLHDGGEMELVACAAKAS
jgi:hypothetical protein